MFQISAAPARAPASRLSASALQQQLQCSPYWSVRQLVCHVDRESIVLRGTVPSYYLKQVAQALALKTVGVGSLCSDIEVQSE